MDEELLKLLSRIKATSDGKDFIEYLRVLSCENYVAFKKDDTANNDIHKGYAIAIDSLIESFEKCDDMLRRNADAKIINEWL